MNRYLDSEGLNVSRNLINGASSVHRSGYRASLQNSVEEVIWTGVASEPFIPTSASVVNIKSTSASDVGILISIGGLDTNYLPISESVLLNGTTLVPTVNAYLRIHSMWVSNGIEPIGSIDALVSGNVVSHVDPKINQSLAAIFTIPSGKTGYLYIGDVAVGKNGDAEVRMYVKYYGGVWLVGHIVQVFQGSYRHDFVFPTPLPERTDIKVTGLSTTTGSKVSCNFDILLVEGSR